MEAYELIPLSDYKRRAHFEYFSSLAQPYAGLTVSIEIQDFLQVVKRKGYPFFLTFLYCVSRSANRIPELRQRIGEEGIRQYRHCPTSHTVALEDGTYCYCALRSDLPFEDYLPYAQAAQEAARTARSLEDGEEGESLFFVSCLPWVSYEALVQPTPFPADSNPRITWGAYRWEGERAVLPVSLLCHHALVDGLHMARFYQALREELDRFAAEQGDIQVPSP